VGQHKLSLSFLIDDSSADYSIESEEEAVAELDKALKDLPPTVRIASDPEISREH